ncbi:hypothetical protein [Peterkaempfera bronchialis]|uniref:Uncharacterized protein n=1 Tax=Peterkaempfera bronchialis TaxID=2126346 RepID=A0A345SQV0_9ACTN|nr:hypothetical protein [Peterkaempfera bronchialis]AXI76105.1 hypothetical protein C7M71_000010 [Peterkaempfera bronchialis]
MPTESAPGAELEPVPPGPARLGAGETAVLITAITAVTVLTIMQRPIPGILIALTSVPCLLLVPGRVGRLFAALATSNRG